MLALLNHSGLAAAIVLMTLVILGILGALAAKLGGASQLRGTVRVVIWGAIAMGSTYAIGRWFESLATS